jgi:Putative prokaryotic signal transducing protein
MSPETAHTAAVE